MRKSLVCAVTGVLLAGLAMPSVAAINDDLQNICTIVKNDDKSELRKKMKSIRDDYNLKLGDFYDGISCSGQSLIRFAMVSNANEAGEYMIKSMSRNELTKTEKDGKTIEQWAEANGHLAGTIGAVLVDRLNGK
ncbi:DUF3718 domain-containing protein [Aliiglaciecola sp. CAU 1673]|uniref:DUF3718 domain-containing protein n=1 Tax=Aliiglaciecola sp. CAU 1673 TaxID=3032595 RepID=UPI0023D9F676|nr:DUF3718 domain-containing protein [Aliiglaciecola sp. CAU 1673]MDF2180155.1 DUF3718 domain-containing protein [Aliiglaciecola sp. CAU 1673]